MANAVSNWLWSTLTGVDLATVQAQSDAADSQLQALNNQTYAPGGDAYNQIADTQGTQAANANWAQVQSDDASSAAGTADAVGQVSDAFNQQLSSETSAISSTAGGFLNGLLKQIWNIIPWQVWLIAAVAAFVYLGGIGLLKNSLSKSNRN